MPRSRILHIIIAALLLLAAGYAQAQGGNSSAGGPSSNASSSSSASTSVAGPAPQSDFSGSVPDKLVSGVLQLSLQDAIARGLKQNLGLLIYGDEVRTAR